MGCYELVKEGETVWDLLWGTCMDLDIAMLLLLCCIILMLTRHRFANTSLGSQRRGECCHIDVFSRIHILTIEVTCNHQKRPIIKCNANATISNTDPPSILILSSTLSPSLSLSHSKPYFHYSHFSHSISSHQKDPPSTSAATLPSTQSQ